MPVKGNEWEHVSITWSFTFTSSTFVLEFCLLPSLLSCCSLIHPLVFWLWSSERKFEFVLNPAVSCSDVAILCYSMHVGFQRKRGKRLRERKEYGKREGKGNEQGWWAGRKILCASTYCLDNWVNGDQKKIEKEQNRKYERKNIKGNERERSHLITTRTVNCMFYCTARQFPLLSLCPSLFSLLLWIWRFQLFAKTTFSPFFLSRLNLIIVVVEVSYTTILFTLYFLLFSFTHIFCSSHFLALISFLIIHMSVSSLKWLI